MILGRYLLTSLGLKLKLSDRVISPFDGSLKGSMAPMFDQGTYEFNFLDRGNITPEESFMNAFTEEIHESEKVIIYTNRLHFTLDTKYKKADLNRVMKIYANIK